MSPRPTVIVYQACIVTPSDECHINAQIEVAAWPQGAGLLYDSDGADDKAGAMFMAACRLEAPAANTASRAADAELQPAAPEVAGSQGRSKRARDV